MEAVGIVARSGRFLREVRAELRKVSWPTRKELISYTVIVLIAVLVVALYIGAIDFVFALLLDLVIK